MATLSSIIPLPAAARTRTSFTATQNQTTFSFTYAVGFLEVFLNGVLLNSGDLTATNGTTFVLNTGVDANDIVEAITHRLVSIGTASAFTGTLPVANGGTGVTTSTGTGNVVLSTSAILTTPDLGTPSAIVLTSGTGLPLTTGVTGTLPVANGGTGVTTSTGTGNVVLSTNAVLTTPALGTPSSGILSSCTVDGTNKVGYLNIPNSGAKTTSYTLVAGDVGKFIELGTSGTVVVPASVFAAGDAISIFNNTSASISCTCSAVTDVYKGGTDADISSFSVTTRGVATILFITATRAVVTGNLV